MGASTGLHCSVAACAALCVFVFWLQRLWFQPLQYFGSSMGAAEQRSTFPSFSSKAMGAAEQRSIIPSFSSTTMGAAEQRSTIPSFPARRWAQQSSAPRSRVFQHDDGRSRAAPHDPEFSSMTMGAAEQRSTKD